MKYLAVIAALIIGLILGAGAVSLIPSPPVTPPAPIIQPDGPNAALLYWRYSTQIPEELSIAASNTLGADEPPNPTTTRYLNENQPVVEGLMRAGAMEGCDFNLEYDQGVNLLAVHLGQVRNAARILGADVRRLAAEGDVDGAIDRIVALIRMSRHLQSDRMIIGLLTASGVAEVGLQELDRLDDLTSAQRQRLIDELGYIDDDDPLAFRAGLAGEKRIALASVGEFGVPLPGARGVISDVFDRAIAVWDDEDAIAALRTIESDAARDWTGAADMLVPSFSRAKEAEQRHLERLATTRDRLRGE